MSSSRSKPKNKPSKLARAHVVGAPADQRLDVSVYARRIQSDVPSTIALAKKIGPRVPKVPASVSAHGRAIADAAAALGDVWREVKSGSPDLRPLDTAVDRAWSAVHDRLAPWATLDDTKKTPLALRLLGVLYPTGLDFTQLPWNAQWAEGDKRLTQLRTQKLDDALVTLVGDEFVSNLRRRQAEYGRALGLDGTSDVEDDDAATKIAPLLQGVQQAIVDYAVQVAAAHNAESDGKKRKVLRAALKPIDDARKAAAPAAKTAAASTAAAATNGSATPS